MAKAGTRVHVILHARIHAYAPTRTRECMQAASGIPGDDVVSDVVELGRRAQAYLLVRVEDNLHRCPVCVRAVCL